jgi:hypothetical protein
MQEKLKITNRLIPNGLIFLWVEKELIFDVRTCLTIAVFFFFFDVIVILRQAVKILMNWGFIYVENLVWVKKGVNNKFVTQPYPYFKRTKLSLLIFRRPSDVMHDRFFARCFGFDWIGYCAFWASCVQCGVLCLILIVSQKPLELRHQRNPDVCFDFVRDYKGIK